MGELGACSASRWGSGSLIPIRSDRCRISSSFTIRVLVPRSVSRHGRLWSRSRRRASFRLSAYPTSYVVVHSSTEAFRAYAKPSCTALQSEIHLKQLVDGGAETVPEVNQVRLRLPFLRPSSPSPPKGLVDTSRKPQVRSYSLLLALQIELHPWCQQKPIVEYCQANGIAVQAYCPIVRGQRFDDPVLVKVAEKLGKTGAQVLIRWSLQKGYV